jgi:hypothetical protein
LEKFLNKADVDLVTRARKAVADPTMLELAEEDPQGNSEYKAAVRHHIIASFQRLRVYLFVMDTLMETYNSSK